MKPQKEQYEICKERGHEHEVLVPYEGEGKCERYAYTCKHCGTKYWTVQKEIKPWEHEGENENN